MTRILMGGLPAVGPVTEEGPGPRARALLVTLGATGIVTVAGVGTGILAARALGPEGRGELAALTIWAATIVSVTSFGIGEATGYYMAKAGPDRRATVLATSRILAVAYGTLAVVCAWVARFLLADRWPAGLSNLLVPYVGLTAIPCVIGLVLVAVLQGMGSIRAFNVARTSVHVANLAAMVGCIAFGVTTVWAFAAATLVGPIVAWIVANRALSGLLPRGRPAGPVLRDLLSYGTRVQFGSLSAMANVRLDQLVLALLVPFGSLGLYVVAVTYCGALNIVSSTFALVMLPAVATPDAPERSARAFVSLTRWGVWACAGAGLVLVAATPIALTFLFGETYDAARAFVPVLVPASVILGLNQMLSSGLRALGAPGAASKGEIIGLAVTIAGLAALVPAAGALGAAWTSLIAYATTCVYLLSRSRRLVVFRFSELFRPSRHDVASLKSLFHAAATR